MAVYGDVTKGAPLPLDELDVATASDTHTFQKLEQESSWSFEPITQPNDLGGERAVGYILTARAYIMYNNFEDMQPVLEDIANNATGFGVFLGGLGGYAERRMTVALLGAPEVKSEHVLVSIQSAEWRPRLILDLRGIVSKDVFDAANFPFTQQGSAW